MGNSCIGSNKDKSSRMGAVLWAIAVLGAIKIRVAEWEQYYGQ